MGKKQKANITARSNSKRDEEIIRKYKKKRILNVISTLIIFGTGFFAVWYSNNRSSFPDDGTRMYVVIAICVATLGSLAFSMVNWRCPSCGKHLGGSIDPQKCRKCGYKFK